MTSIEKLQKTRFKLKFDDKFEIGLEGSNKRLNYYLHLVKNMVKLELAIN